MDWELIKEKYPKAWEKFFLFRAKANAEADGVDSLDGDIFKNRDLYDLFDENGIIIEITRSHSELKNFIGWFEYYIYLDDILKTCSMDNKDYTEPYTKTRTEAEEQAFLKAFEILNNKLEK